jgi:hypothetical protein
MSEQFIEKAAREEVSRENLQSHIEYFCSLGEKLAGSVEEVKACNYIVSQLAAAGIEAQVFEFEAYVSHPGPARVTTYFPEKMSIEAVGISFSVSTPAEGLSAEIVSVGNGAAKDYVGLDVAGKIVLVNTKPRPESVTVAYERGAVALIGMSEGHALHKLIATPVWGIPSLKDKGKIPRIPVASISGHDGAVLRRLAKAGTLKGTVTTEVWEGWKILHTPVAEIPGSRPEFILVGGHYCSWFDGATDNATGNSCLIELARILKKNQKALRYGIRLAWWPGHSNGRYAGSAWYADTFWQELYDNGIVYFNIDSPGVKGATVYAPRHQMAEISEFNESSVAELTEWSTVTTPEVQLAHGRAGKYVSPTRPPRAGDQSFCNIGLTSIGVYGMLPAGHPDRGTVGGSGGAWWWHSKDDTIDKADADILAQDTRLYISIMLRLATISVLPFNFAASAQDYLDALREYQEESGESLPLQGLLENLAILKEKATALREQSKNLEDEAITGRLNRLYLSLARTLNPPLYTSNEPFEFQPALPTHLLPDLEQSLKLKKMEPGSDDFKFLVTELKRKITKINFRLLTAIRLIDSWRA